MVLEYPIVVAKIKVTDATAEVLWSQDIPKGLVGGRVLIEYADDKWNELNKTVVFRGAVTRDVLSNDSEVIIPAEVLSRSGINFYVGIYGTNAEKNLGVPTFWAKVGVIRDAADPNEDPAADPSLPVWAGLLERTPDWNALPSTDNHILNRTHWSVLANVDFRFDGNLENRNVIPITDGYTFVKVSDQVMTEAALLESTFTIHTISAPDEDINVKITEDMIMDGASEGFPVLIVGEYIVSAMTDFDIYGFHIEKGLYFLYYAQENTPIGYISALTSSVSVMETIHKLDNKFLDAEWTASRTEGVETILEEAVQPFSGSSAKQNFQFNLEAGKTYEVTWDGDIYLCTAGQISEEYISVSYMGNAHFMEDEYPDTGEPFCIACLSIMGIQLLSQIAASDSATEHRIGIKQVGKIRTRLPFSFMPQRYVMPSDLYYSGVKSDELETAYFHMMRGGEVYANYSNNRFKVLMINLDIFDGLYSSLVMTNGDVIMMWSQENGWVKQARNSIMLDGYDGKKFRITVGTDNTLTVSDVTNQTIYV